MPTTTPSGNQTGLPEGCCAIPILESEVGAIVRLCVLVKQAPDPAGQLILLRDLPDAMVYLGCLMDAGGRVHEWVELWVQNLDGLESSLPALREAFSNHSLDRRWTEMAASFAALDPGGVLQTGWEAKHPMPVLLDVAQGRPVHPAGSPDPHWELCQEDAVLQAAGLPTYGTSLFRYLYQRTAQAGPFLPVVAGAPTSAATQPLTEVVQTSSERVPLNLQGGLLMARRHLPLSYEDYADLLGGKPWKGMENGKRLLNFDGVYRNLGDATQMQQSGSHLFLGGQGRAGRFVEGFHLKLRLFLEACTAVRGFVEQQQVPFLNLSSDSFNVGLKDVGARLPFLWAAGCSLVKPTEAFALPVESSDVKYFIRARSGGTSIYCPDNLNAAVQATGRVRVRTVLPPDQGRTLLEATLAIPEGLEVSEHDLLWVRLPLPSGRVDLYGHLYTTDGLSQGEARFRTVAQHLSSEVVSALRAAEGVSFARSPFEVVPLLSTPCDLYSLGVLAVRTFLVNPQNTLAVALDETLSLARRVAEEYNSEVPLPERIGAILASDARFAKSLAPHRLVQEPMDPMTALELLPPEMWHHTLAMMVRLFPGIGPDSYCQDYGDAPALALEVVFNRPLEDLEQLLIRSRSLIVIDWSANREIHSTIRDVLDRHPL